jgi:diguanylate cyclase (GGDEF)-like protein/PAS domain S-box-containing protein
VDLFSRLLDPASYVYNAYALPQLACALITFVLGVTVFVREHGTRVGVLYLFQTLAIGTWLLGFSVADFAADTEIAQSWLRLGHVGVSLIPALTLQFTWAVVRPTTRVEWLLWLGWAGSGAFVVLTLGAPWFFDTPYRYPWGYYSHSTAYSAALVPFLFVLFGFSLWLYWQAYRRAPPNSVAARRAKLLYIAFSIGGLGAIDFLPAFGVGVYPFGYVPILIGIGLVTYVTGRHRLVDITPAFAANQILDTINDGLFVLDKDGVVQVANNALLTMIGAKKDNVIGKGIPASLRRLLTRAEFASIQAGVPMHNREVELKRRDGTAMVLNLAVSIMRERAKENVAYVCVLRDITERKRAEERIRFLAYYDSLTSLPNRQLFEEQLSAALATAARNNRIVAVLFLDLDHFKRINDTLGHTLGDALLQAIAGRLLACVRKERTGAKGPEDTVARLGGDEFIVALYDLDEQDDALHVAERILAVVCEPMRLDQHEIAITASLGISIYPHDGDDVGVLLKNADAAMYQAKEAGRNNYILYDRTMNIATYDRLSLQAKLRRALEQGSLTLQYQPQVATHSKETVGVEALLRWYDPVLGWIPPSRFIPIAEECGLILPIGDWVLKTACAQVRAWEDAGLPALRVAVNLSSRQFRDRDLISIVREALHASRLEPYRLELEITESIIMQDALRTRQTLEALKRMGVRLSIDDFGTGYSSLSYLRSFPIDTLKIDRTFVQDIAATPDNGAIVAAIIAMARSLKLGVIAEGVDTEEQLAFLELHGCKLAQGFLFCKPLPPSELQAWMQMRHARVAR